MDEMNVLFNGIGTETPVRRIGHHKQDVQGFLHLENKSLDGCCEKSTTTRNTSDQSFALVSADK